MIWHSSARAGSRLDQPPCQNEPVIEQQPQHLLPVSLKPRDGRFGSGPAKIRPEAMQALASAPQMGTSHRQRPVRDLVARIQQRLAELYAVPDGYQVALGNGGSTLFWDLATFSLIDQRSAHGVFGEFSSKFAAAATRAPFLAEPLMTSAPSGRAVLPEPGDADVLAWAHNETSTGACAPVRRPDGADPEALVVVDGTSAAGAMPIPTDQTDVYYFAPQKNLGSDGGLWLALCSPSALARAERLHRDRWIPEILDLHLAAQNSAQHQSLNTPALATLVLLADQLDWLADQGGLAWAAERTADASGRVYDWANQHELATPFVEPQFRSPVVATIDLDHSVDATALTAALRANGIVDTEPYRKLGRNQLRIGCYVSVEPDDVSALLACIDQLLSRGVGQQPG